MNYIWSVSGYATSAFCALQHNKTLVFILLNNESANEENIFPQSGKQKASSPIDADTVSKKQKPHVSDTDEMEVNVQSDHGSIGVPDTGDFV